MYVLPTVLGVDAAPLHVAAASGRRGRRSARGQHAISAWSARGQPAVSAWSVHGQCMVGTPPARHQRTVGTRAAHGSAHESAHGQHEVSTCRQHAAGVWSAHIVSTWPVCGQHAASTCLEVAAVARVRLELGPHAAHVRRVPAHMDAGSDCYHHEWMTRRCYV